MSANIEFRVDKIKNRLYIKLNGFFRRKHVEPAMPNRSRRGTPCSTRGPKSPESRSAHETEIGDIGEQK